MEAKLLLTAALLSCVAAVPFYQAAEDKCARSCRPATKFTYQAQQTYSYDYVVQTTTSMDGASEERAALWLHAQADLEVLDQCEHVLLLKKVRIDESDPANGGGLTTSPRSEELRRVLESFPLRFAFQDGVVEELCPDDQEDPWALNVKRGLLSALQNSMDSLESSHSVLETGVTGTCPTQYEVNSQGYWAHIKHVTRHKQLMACTDRHGYTGTLQTAVYHVTSDIQSLPLIASEDDCQQEISQGIIQSSTCTESHLFRPFSSEGNGALTTVTQKLKLIAQQTGISSRTGWIPSRAAMTFDHGVSVKDSNEARTRTESLLGTLCDVTVKGIQLEVPRVFSQLVGAMKALDVVDMRDLYQRLQRGQLCSMNNDRTKKFFLDALPMAGSSQTLQLMKELLLSADVQGVQVDLWLNSLAFITQPTADMVDSAKELLQYDKLKMRAMLPVSALVNTFCQKQDCSGPVINSILQALEDSIGDRCSVNDGNIKTVLTTLSAIGNTGQDRAVDILNRCLRDSVPMEVRVAAAQAFRRMPCEADKRQLLAIAKDSNQDSEIRAAAYLQLMTCPTSELLTQVQVIMEDEAKDSQVGSFIWSHLSNLKETSSPFKQDIKQLLTDLKLKRLFDLNPLKFSRNYEKRVFMRALNSGVQVESNVIWSAQSPLPRSLTANLTFDLFGRSINLLEIGGRLEGLEYLIENVQNNFFGDGKEKSAKQKLDQLKGSGFARIFGNELAYSRFQGINTLNSGNTFNVLDFLVKLSNDHDYSFTQSLQFLDSSIIVPTSAGLPLTLSVNGSAVVDVKASGKMDLRKVSKSPRSLYVDGEIRPSGAVNVDGVMSVDALVTRTGLKVTSSMKSSMALKGRVELDRGRVLNLQLDMPDDKIDILDVRSQFFILHNKVQREQKMITDNRKQLELCTGKMAAKVTGLELCGQLQFPNASTENSGPYFPFTGPTSLSLVLYKRDSHTGYKLLAKRVENKRSSIAQLSFDTPGSSVMRAVSVDVMINYLQKGAELSFASPWKKASVKGSLMNESGMKSLAASLVIDDEQTYSVSAEVKVDEQQDNMKVFTPLLELRRPGGEPVTLMGSVRMELGWKQLSTDLTFSGATKKPIQLQASYANTQTDKSISGTFTYGEDTYSAQTGVVYKIRRGKNLAAEFSPTLRVVSPEGELINLQGNVDYRQEKFLRSDLTLLFPGGLAKPINFKCDITQKSRKTGSRYDVDLRLKSRPFTGKISGIINMADTQAAKLTIDYNIYRIGQDRVTISGKLSDKSTGALKKYTLFTSVEFLQNPEWNVQGSLGFDHKKRHTEGELVLVLGKDPDDQSQKILLSAFVDRKVKDLNDMDINYKMKVIAPMLGINASVDGDHAHTPDSLACKVTVKYGEDKNAKAAINLNNKSDKQLKMSGDASLSFPGHSYEVDSALKKSGKQYVHTVNVNTHNGQLVALSSTFKTSKDSAYDVTSDIRLDGFKPAKVSGSTNLQWDDFQLVGQLLHGPDSYAIQTVSKMSTGPRGNWLLKLSHPARSLELSANGGLQKSSLDLDMAVAWDKDRDDSAKVTISLTGGYKDTRTITSSNGKLEITSPFQTLQRLSGSFNFDNDLDHFGLDGKVTVGDQPNTYYSSLDVRKPLAPGKVVLTWSAGSPIRGWKRLDASVEHSADGSSLNTLMKASKEESQVQLSLIGTDKSRGSTVDLAGDLTIKTDFPQLQGLTITLGHKTDGLKYQSRGEVTHNTKRYALDLDMSHFRRDWQVQNTGQLKTTCSEHTTVSNWQLRSSYDDLDLTWTSRLDRGKQLQVKMSGTKQWTDTNKKLTSTVGVRSPWPALRDFSMTLNHEMREGFCKHTAAIIYNSQKQMSTDVSYTPGNINGQFLLSTPFLQEKSGSLSAKYSSYPITVHLELQPAPGSSLTGDLSFTKTADWDMDGNARLTTPYRMLRTISLSGSTQREADDLLLKARVDYDVRHNYDLEIRLRPDSWNMGRVKVNTPLTEFSALDTGYQFSGDYSQFDVTADVSLQPTLGKYSGIFNWQLNNDLSARMRINTPRSDFQYIQLTATSQVTAEGRKSRLAAEYYPRKIYALTALYNFDLPVVFSLSTESPIPAYDKLGVSFRHQQSQTTISTQAEVQYLPGQIIDSSFTLDWQQNMDGALVIKTPFEKFEESKVTIHHEGNWEDFNSNAAVNIMRETLAANAEFKSGFTSSGKFSLTSSLKDLQKMDASFKKRGWFDDFRSSVTAAYGHQRVEGTLKHKYDSRNLQTSVTFTSPFTERIESSINYLNKQGGVDVAVSGQYGKQKVESSGNLQIALPSFSLLGYTLGGQQQAPRVMVDMTFSAKDSDNEQKVSVKGELNAESDIRALLQVTTPFRGFERVGLEFNHSNNDVGFTQRGSLTYMTGKQIRHMVNLNYDGLRFVQLETTLTSPLPYLEKTSLLLQHSGDAANQQCTGSAKLQSALGSHRLNYKRVGDWQNLAVEVAVDGNGQTLESQVDWALLTDGYKHGFQLKTSKDTLTYAVSKSGPSDDVSVQLQGSLNSQKVSATAQFTKVADEISGALTISTPVDGFSKVGGSFKYSGDTSRFNWQGKATYMDNKEISSKINFYRYMWSRVEASAELATPFTGLRSSRVEFRHANSADGITCTSLIEYGNSQKISADLRATYSPKYDLSLTIKTPFRLYRKMVADAKLESLANTHSASISLDLGRDLLYAVDGSVDMDSTPMTLTGKLSTPSDMLGNVELSASNQGRMDDFSGMFSFNSPQTDVIKGDVMFRYVSVFDLQGTASLTTEIEPLQDLRLEIKNTDSTTSKSGHLMARWAPNQQVSLDGSYSRKDYWNNQEVVADVSLASPFEQARSASLHVEHHKKDSKYTPRVQMALNGERLLDMEGQLVTGDSPVLSVSTHKPWPTQLTSSFRQMADEKQGEVYLSWNRDQNDKNVRLQASMKNVVDQLQKDIDYSLKVILPSRTVSSGLTLLQQEKKMTSGGYLSWDEDTGSKVYYNLELNDASQYYGKNYDGTIKLGFPSRTLQGTGSFSKSRQTSALDATLSWDAGRDASKQLGLVAKVISGQKTKADVTLRLPAIGKELHIDHEMMLDQGSTVWDGRTELSYSPDSRKTLTLSSSLKDVSDSYSTGKNYSLLVSISHPHTNTDISVTSHIGTSSNSYSAAMDTVYMTSRRQRKNMALRGEIDRLRRQISFELVSPVKKMSMHGEILSTEPYIIKLNSLMDNKEAMQSELNIDQKQGSLQFTTNYGQGRPELSMVLKAAYLNDTALRAELTHGSISDSLLTMRLNTSTLLHSRLTWRPDALTDIQNLARQRTLSFSQELRDTFASASSATGQELRDKYSAITNELHAELSPLLALLEDEAQQVWEETETTRRELQRLVSSNHFYLQDIGTFALRVLQLIRDYSDAYKMSYVKSLDTVKQQLDTVRNYNLLRQYNSLIDKLSQNLPLEKAINVDWLSSAITQLQEQLQAIKNGAYQIWDLANYHPLVQRLKERLQVLERDYQWLMGYLDNSIQQVTGLPDHYSTTLYNARDVVLQGLSDVIESRHVQKVKNAANEIYQQGAWAYNYWQVKENAREQLENLIKLLAELIKEELKEMTPIADEFWKSKVTVYNPEQGEIQVEVVLPIALQTLRQWPDLQTHLQETSDLMQQYIPDKSTILHFYNQYYPWIAPNQTSSEEPDIMADLKVFQPEVRSKLRKFTKL